MANQRYVLEFSLEDVGGTLKGRKKDADAYRGSLDSIIKAHDRINSSSKGGWKKAAMGNNEYDIARGSAGATGASGRDFANQARGLDGLVRLYATYAANVFAAGAAFRALSQAADTTNMIKGMDQLGAVSGQALGTVAKRLVDATDGAISFREALEATTKGTSAGLSSSQMVQLGEVAKKASQALGVSMPDAISRLSRGISKLEPELLDELGIFTKIDPAVQAYARSIGKTAASLTDFERRQAFATAVLKEGLDKFGGIDISANPYDKLLASLQNLGQSALEIVNKVLTPLVSVLSQSPTALLAVLTAIGVSIVKSAIPALGQYRENLKNAADQSRLVFTQIYKDQQQALSDLAINAAFQAEKTYKNTAGVRSRIADLEKQAKSFSKGKKDFSTLAGKDPYALTPQEIKSLDDRARYLASRDKAESDRLKAHIAEIKALRAEATAAGDIAQKSTEGKTEGVLTTAGANDILYKRKLTQASMDAIKVNVAETQAIYGMRAAFSKLGAELSLARAGLVEVEVGVDKNGKKLTETAPKLGNLGTAYTAVTSTVGILGAKIGTTMSALNPWIIAIGLAVEALGLLDAWLTKTSKESSAFNKALQYSEDSIDNVTRVLDIFNTKQGVSPATISGIFALSNAMNDLTTSTQTTINAADKLKTAINMSAYDSLRNWVLGAFGKDVDTELAKTLAASVQSTIKLLGRGGQRPEGEKILKQALGVEALDVTTLTNAFKKGGDIVDRYSDAQKKLNTLLGNSSSNLQSFKTATEASTKAYQEFIQSTAANNPLFKLGESLQNVSFSMSKTLKGSISDLNAAFNDLTDHPEKAALFGSQFVSAFSKIRGEFKSTFDQVSRTTSKFQEYEDKILEAEGKLADFEAKNGKTQGGAQQRRKIEILKMEQASINTTVDTSVFTRARTLFIDGIGASFQKGTEIISKAMGQANEKAAITVAQARAGALSGERAAIESNNLREQEINIQLSAVELNMEILKSQERLTVALERSTNEYELSRTDDPEQYKALFAHGKALEQYSKSLDQGAGKNGRLEFQTTGDAEADSYLKDRLQRIGLSMAMQQATKIVVQAQKTALGITGQREVVGGRFQDLTKISQLEDSITQQQIAQLNITAGIGNASSEQLLKTIAIKEANLLESKQSLETLDIRNKLNDAATQAEATNKKTFFDEISFLTKVLGLTEKRQQLERDVSAEQARNKLLDERYTKEKLIRDIKYQNQEGSLKITAATLGAEQELLSVQESLGMIYGEEAENKKRALDRAILSNSITQSELTLEKERANVLADIALRRAKLGPNASSDAIKNIEDERAANVKKFEDERAALNITNQGKREAQDLTQSLTTRQLAYAEVFKQSFSSMADAIVEFAKTGKFSFKNLISSMLEGLLRYELQLQAMAMYSMARPGLMNLVGGLFGFAPALAAGAAPSISTMSAVDYSFSLPSKLSPLAKGGVYDTGLQTFAKGGMFTNSIVSSPTLFKFAKGTGLMGEAGPEAIMPLKRDGNGNLGVRSNQGKVDVVVNNYSTQQATTKETMDSRGNRRIEVIVGDMVAGELNRVGSNTQQAMTAGYGTSPLLARR